MKLSFVIPAHDEEQLLGATLAAVDEAARCTGEPFEVIVVDDASSDATARIAREAGARVVHLEARQIAAARNAGAAVAGGEALLFVDADTIVGGEVVRAAVESLRSGAVGGGAAVRFDEPSPRWARILLALFLWLNRRLRLAPGCFLYCTREAFEAVGGFDPTLFAAEEIYLSRALGRRGPFRVLRHTVTTSGRKVRAHSAGQVIGTLTRLTLTGRRGLRDRGHLSFWYGPRPPDRRHGAR